jgi:hypothetical protein
MKKFLIIFGLVLGFASAVYADGYFCCGGGKTKEECCAERGKLYCENDAKCRTRCRGVTPPECIGAVSILRESVVYGVRRRRYVHIKDYVKESWMGVIYVIRVPLIALARSV